MNGLAAAAFGAVGQQNVLHAGVMFGKVSSTNEVSGDEVPACTRVDEGSDWQAGDDGLNKN